MARKTALRKPISIVSWPLVRPFRARLERDSEGGRLQPGITAVVAARNEGYTIPFCLRSLIGVADQIVCIDNGSDDDTVQQMEAFRDEHSRDVRVDVVTMPGALLGDCRQEGLRLTRHQWHLRWDADMVAKTSGPESMIALRERVLASDRPRTIQLPRTNLVGDLRHTGRLGHVVDPGEPILMRAGHGVSYREFGKFDTVRVPLHFAIERESGRHYFHLAGLKSAENLIHRFHYFSWRERVNRDGDALPPELQAFEGYKQRMNENLFGTNDSRSLKFRYCRQLSYHFVRYDPARHGDYPDVLRPALAGPQRFEVVYRDGRPWTRIDHADAEQRDYEPTPEDLAWDPEAFLRRILSADDCRGLGIEPAQ